MRRAYRGSPRADVTLTDVEGRRGERRRERRAGVLGGLRGWWSWPGPERQRQLIVELAAAAITAAGVLFLVLLLTPGDPRFTTAWTTAVLGLFAGGAGLLSAAAGATSAATARRALGQQLYELARATHHDLTTGEVAAARDRLGALVRARRQLRETPIPPHHTWDTAIKEAYDPRNNGEAIAQWRRDWFTLLWCFQRLHAALVLLAQTPPELVAAGQQSPRDFLADLVRSQVRFLNTDAGDIRAALEEYQRTPVDDGESTTAFRDLVTDLLPGTAHGRWADAVSTEHGEVLLALLLELRDEVLRVRDDVVLADFREDQLDALLGAVAPPHRQRRDERTTIADRLRAEARQLEQRDSPPPTQPPEPQPDLPPDKRRRRDVARLRDAARAFAAGLPGEGSDPAAPQSVPTPGKPRAET